MVKESSYIILTVGSTPFAQVEKLSMTTEKQEKDLWYAVLQLYTDLNAQLIINLEQ